MVLSISFDNGVVEKGGVPITFDSPFFFGSLDVVGFIFCKEFMVLLGLKFGRLALLLKKLILDEC